MSFCVLQRKFQMLKSKRLEITNICYAIVSGNFAICCNPVYRSADFKWEDFAQMQADQCREKVFEYMPTPASEDEKNAIETMVTQFGREVAQILVEHAGFIENKP